MQRRLRTLSVIQAECGIGVDSGTRGKAKSSRLGMPFNRFSDPFLNRRFARSRDEFRAKKGSRVKRRDLSLTRELRYRREKEGSAGLLFQGRRRGEIQIGSVVGAKSKYIFVLSSNLPNESSIDRNINRLRVTAVWKKWNTISEMFT